MNIKQYMERLWILGLALSMPCFANAPLPSIATTQVLPAKQTPDWQVVGIATAANVTTLTAEVNGLVTDIYVSDGMPIQKDTAIVQLNEKVIKAQWAMAKSEDELASLRLKRLKTLFKKKVITAMAMDEARLNAQTTHQKMLSYQAQRQQLAVRAPFSGLLGIIHVHPGDYLIAGQTPIATLTQRSPMWIDFSLHQSELSSIHLGDQVTVHVGKKTRTATITAMDSTLDTQTHHADIRAKIDNKDGLLSSGAYVSVDKMKTQNHANRVPMISVGFDPSGPYVFILRHGHFEKTPVKLGANDGIWMNILDGVHPKEVVATEGRQKIFPGIPVNALKPVPYDPILH